jgi:hypothetical protein
MKSFLRLLILCLLCAAAGNSCKKEYSCENCLEANKPPIANAGRDTILILPVDSLVLDGSRSTDSDGQIIKYQWSKIAGPASSSITGPTLVTTLVKTLAIGVYVFELTVTDNGGLTAKDTVQININGLQQVNHPPIANAGADQTIMLPTSSVSLDGSASTDPDHNITSYTWTKIEGPATFSFSNSGSSKTLANNLSKGIYFFELKVTDATGLFSKDTLRVTVSDQIVSVDVGGDIIITLPLDSVYLGLYHYPNSFTWTMISGPSVVVISNTSYNAVVLVNNLTVGNYSFRYEEVNGATITVDTITVTVINDPGEQNTITFKELPWIIHDEYGIGINDLSLRIPAQPHFFFDGNTIKPVLVYLKETSSSPWLLLPLGAYTYDSSLPHIWIMRLPVDPSWVGKISSVKIKLL